MGLEWLVEQADDRFGGRHLLYHTHLKKSKNCIEWWRAKRNPECQPAYRQYHGYET
jgi:hypothetical protein